VNLFTAAERLAAIDRSEITLDAGRCLHSRDKFAACEACLNVCPADAIQADKPPRLDSTACASCLTCLPLCPSGAFSADDSVADLLNCAARIESRAVELVCQAHPRAETGLSAGATGIRLRGCLAGLGSGTYLALAALGVEQVTLRLDACGECPWASLRGQAEKQFNEAKQLLSAWGRAETLCLTDALTEPVERLLWDVKNPPLSRRDMFLLVSRQGQIALARAIENQPPKAGKSIGRNRTRMIHAAAQLGDLQDGSVSLAGMDFAMLTINESCSACGACARICPTDALTFESDEEAHRYALRLSPKECINCEACIHVCMEKAVSVDSAPMAEQVWGPKEAVLLQSGELSRCEHCSAPFAARQGIRLCPTCEYRRKNPFGSRLPAGMVLPGGKKHDH
jgi:ferredoxin